MTLQAAIKAMLKAKKNGDRWATTAILSMIQSFEFPHTISIGEKTIKKQLKVTNIFQEEDGVHVTLFCKDEANSGRLVERWIGWQTILLEEVPHVVLFEGENPDPTTAPDEEEEDYDEQQHSGEFNHLMP